MTVLSASEERTAGAVPLAVLAAVWFALAVVTGAAGVYSAGESRLPVAIGMAAIGPPLLVALALWGSGRFRAWAESLDLPLLINLQAWRLVGFVFIVLFALNLLPGGFALPAGLGDIAAALAAPFVAHQVIRGTPIARPAFVAWTVFGIADLLTAVTLGTLHSQAPWALLADATVNTDPMTYLPLSLIPTFGVPYMLTLHVLSLARFRAGIGRS